MVDGQGGQAHRDLYFSMKRKLANLEAQLYTRLDARHNGMLRRYNGCLSVLRTLEDALKSILPPEYRNARIVLTLTLGYYFKNWRRTPNNWYKAAEKDAGLMERSYNTVVRIGRRARPISNLHGEVVSLDKFHRDEQAKIVDEARKNGLAPLAAVVLSAGQKVHSLQPPAKSHSQI